MKRKILPFLFIPAGAVLLVLAIAYTSSALTPHQPAPPPTDTPAAQLLSPDFAETLGAATRALSAVQPPQVIGQASAPDGSLVPYVEIPLLSSGTFFEQSLGDGLTVWGVHAFTLNRSGLLHIDIVWGLLAGDDFIYALAPDQTFTQSEAQADAQIRLPRGRLFAIALAGTGCADAADLDWQACTAAEPGYASLFRLGEFFSSQKTTLFLINRIATQSSLNGWLSTGWPVVFPFINDLVELP